MAHDLVIRNGVVYDGTGTAGRLADVAVDDGLITEVSLSVDHGHEEIEADGLAVSPGFVDGHAHMDAQFFWDPLGSSSCWHGVTTVVMGNCGFTLAPVRSDARELVVRNLERAEDLAPEALAAGIDWQWESFADYLEAIDRLPKAISVGSYVGHSALRTWAMGERAFTEQPAEDDLAAMEGELARALDAGAIGFSTSRSPNHETSDDHPVASRMADWDEVVRLVSGLTGRAGAVFALAVEPGFRNPDPAVRTESAKRLLELARSSKVTTTFGIASPNPQSATLLEVLAEGNRTGAHLVGQTHSRGVTSIMSFESQLPFDALPEWQPFRALPVPSQLQRLRDPEVRAALRDSAVNGRFANGIGAEMRPPDYDRMRVMLDPVGPNPTVASLAADRCIHPVDVILDRAIESELRQLFIQPLTPLELPDLLEIMKSPHTAMTFSDTGAHVSQISDASIQTFLLSYWVRMEQAFSLPEAIRMITDAPARAWHLADRGRVEPGLRADLNVFDPATVAPLMPEVVHDLPAGAKRLRQGATGLLATVVGGQITFRDGEHTGAFAGELIRRRG